MQIVKFFENEVQEAFDQGKIYALEDNADLQSLARLGKFTLYRVIQLEVAVIELESFGYAGEGDDRNQPSTPVIQHSERKVS